MYLSNIYNFAEIDQLITKNENKIMYMKRFLLISIATLLGASAYAQMSDVTSQYIPNASFETCEAVEITECKGYGTVVHGNGYSLIVNSSVAAGYDYTSTGWKLLSQNTNANGGVVCYNGKVQYSKSGYESSPAAGPLATSGEKGLCFCGNNSLVYQQTEAITLSAGSYRFTVRVYPYNGAYSHEQPTMKVKDQSGFVTSGGTTYFSKNLSANKEITVNSNAWNEDVIEFELTEETTGHFQVSYGTQYFLVIDDVMLEAKAGVVTTALEEVITKAQVLNRLLANDDLSTAINSANAFVEAPTSQADVTTQVTALWTAIGAALKKATTPVDVTAIFVDNPSFETGKMDTWSGTAESQEPEVKSIYTDGDHLAAFAYNSSEFNLSQTLSNLPAGYYLLTAKLRGDADLKLGGNATSCKGGLASPASSDLFLRVCSGVINTTGGVLIIGAESTKTFFIDDFHLFYGPDEASLLANVYQAVKADAEAILKESRYAAILGEEKGAVQTALTAEGDNKLTLIENINAAVRTFVAAKDTYDKWEKTKSIAAAYTFEAYPYGDGALLQQIQTLTGTQPESRTQAQQQTTEVEELCFNFYVSNAYAEGVKDRVDYTDKIAGAKATSPINTAWLCSNVAIRVDKTGYTNPKTKRTESVVYGVTQDFYRTGANQTASMQQTIKDLPVGKYVFAITAMAATNEKIAIVVNEKTIGEITGVGTSGGGKLGAGWNEGVFGFEKTAEGNLTLRIEGTLSANYKDWYVDNMRLFGYETIVNGIQSVNQKAVKTSVYNLQGHRVSQPSKGLYIINGKKVVLK